MTSDEQHARFAAEVMPHLADAYTLARWLTQSRADADDVLQEACMRAFSAIDRRSGQNPRAWLMAIVRNTAYTWINGRRSATMIGIDDLNEKDRLQVESSGNGADGPIDPEAGMIARADLRQIGALIEDLPLEFRETLVLRDLQGFRYHEIADVTGVPVGTVMSRLARARQRLMAAIRESHS